MFVKAVWVRLKKSSAKVGSKNLCPYKLLSFHIFSYWGKKFSDWAIASLSIELQLAKEHVYNSYKKMPP